MRKFALAGLAVCLSVGLTLAADVVFVGFDKEKKELKVKEDGEEKTYLVTDKTEFKRGDKEVKHDKGVEFLDKMNGNEKAKGKAKMKIKADKKDLTEVELPGKKRDK